MSAEFGARRREPSLLVVTPCSARKCPRTDERASAEELESEEGRQAALRRLGHWAHRSQDLYCGRHHLSVLRSLQRLRQALPGSDIGLSIVSAGYGVLMGSEWIVPYDVTFASMSRLSARARAERLQIHERLTEHAARYTVVLYLLGRDYLEAIVAPLRASPLEVYFAPPGLDLRGNGVVHVRAGTEEAKRLGSNARMVKADLFLRFVEDVERDGWESALAWASGDQISVLSQGISATSPGRTVAAP